MKNETKKRIKTICKNPFKFGVIAGALAAGTGAGLATGTFASGLVNEFMTVELVNNDTVNKLVKGYIAAGTGVTVGIVTLDKSARAIASVYGVKF